MGSVSKQHMDRMLVWLRQVAADGAACPTNDMIADRFGYGSPARSSLLLKQMEAEGAIALERFQASRVVTIVGSGLSTARPANTRPHWRDAQRPARPAVADAEAVDDIGPAPFLPIRAIARDDAALAAAIEAEATRLARPIPTFLSELVARGWAAYSGVTA